MFAALIDGLEVHRNEVAVLVHTGHSGLQDIALRVEGLRGTGSAAQSKDVAPAVVLTVHVNEQLAVAGDVLVDNTGILIDLDSILIVLAGTVVVAVHQELEAGGGGLDEGEEVAAAAQEHVIADAASHLGHGLDVIGIVDVLMHARLFVDSTVSGGSGQVVAVDLVDLSCDRLGLVGLGLTVDEGIVDHIVHSQSIGGDDLLGLQLIDFIAVGELDVLGIQGVRAVGDLGDLGGGVDDLQDVLSDAVLVVVDDLDPVALLIGLDLRLGILIDVLGDKLLVGHAVGQVLQAGSTGIHLAVGVTVTVVLDTVEAVGMVKDGLDVFLMLAADLFVRLKLRRVGPAIMRAVGIGEGDSGLLEVLQLDSPAVVGTVALVLSPSRAGTLGNIGGIADEVDLVTDTPVGHPAIALAEVDVTLSGVVQGDAVLLGKSLQSILVLDLGSTLSSDVAFLAVIDGEDLLAILDVSDMALTDIVQSGGVVDGIVLTIHQHLGSAVGEGIVLVQVGILVGGNDALDFLQLQAVIAQGGSLLGVAEGIGVEVNLVDQDGPEQDFGYRLTGSGLAQHSLGHILGDAALIRNGSSTNLPVAAGELAVLVVAHCTQDHCQSFVTSHLALGIKDLVAAALDVAGIGAVVDVSCIPGTVRYVSELTVGGIDRSLAVCHIAGSDAVDDSSHFCAGDVALGLERCAVVVALEHFQAVEDIDGSFIAVADIPIVREGAGGRYEREAHDQRQHQCENLLQISHGGCFLLFIFPEPVPQFLPKSYCFLVKTASINPLSRK